MSVVIATSGSYLVVIGCSLTMVALESYLHQRLKDAFNQKGSLLQRHLDPYLVKSLRTKVRVTFRLASSLIGWFETSYGRSRVFLETC